MYAMDFCGFRDGRGDRAEDGKTLRRLRRACGHLAYWDNELNHFEVLYVLVQHDTKAVTVELLINDDFQGCLEVPLSSLLEVAPPDLVSYLLDELPRLQEEG